MCSFRPEDPAAASQFYWCGCVRAETRAPRPKKPGQAAVHRLCMSDAFSPVSAGKIDMT
eukprot:COSAG01_NODE_49480_length_371_cov_85.382353_1_plen_58_part_01